MRRCSLAPRWRRSPTANGVARGLVYQWLRQLREGRMPGLSLNKPGAAVAFAPVSVVSEGSDEPRGKPVPTLSLPRPAQPASAAPTSMRRSSAVEIRLPNGRVIKVDESIEAQALARLLAVIDGDRS
jgi:transposase